MKILSTRLLLMKIARVVLRLLLSTLTLLLSISDIFDIDLRVLSKVINSKIDKNDLKMKNASMLSKFDESKFI